MPYEQFKSSLLHKRFSFRFKSQNEAVKGIFYGGGIYLFRSKALLRTQHAGREENRLIGALKTCLRGLKNKKNSLKQRENALNGLERESFSKKRDFEKI
jgi:hypothetical protein